MTEQPTTGPHQAAGTKNLTIAATLGTLGALAGTSLVFLATRVADLELVVTPPGQSQGPVPYAALVGAVVVSGAAALTGALLFRRLPDGRRWFVGLSSLALIASFASPVGAAAAASTALVLSAMHLIVGAALIPLLARRMKENEK